MKNSTNSDNLEITPEKSKIITGIATSTLKKKKINIKDFTGKARPENQNSFSLVFKQRRILEKLEAECLLKGETFFASQAWEKYNAW